jgi:hypothetical protein
MAGSRKIKQGARLISRPQPVVDHGEPVTISTRDAGSGTDNEATRPGGLKPLAFLGQLRQSSIPLKTLGAVLVALTFVLAPLLAAGAELLPPPACSVGPSDRCARHSGKPAKETSQHPCADCALCLVNCCNLMLLTTDQILTPERPFAKWPGSTHEIGLQRTYPPPLPPPRAAA